MLVTVIPIGGLVSFIKTPTLLMDTSSDEPDLHRTVESFSNGTARETEAQLTWKRMPNGLRNWELENVWSIARKLLKYSQLRFPQERVTSSTS